MGHKAAPRAGKALEYRRRIQGRGRRGEDRVLGRGGLRGIRIVEPHPAARGKDPDPAPADNAGADKRNGCRRVAEPGPSSGSFNKG